LIVGASGEFLSREQEKKMIEKLVPIGHPNRPGTKLDELLAIVIHYTGNDHPQADDTMNASYFGRVWKGTLQAPFEADGVTPFGYGSAHVIFDQDSGTMAIPLDEVAWHVGDRRLPYTPETKGQQPMARKVFDNRQNYKTVGVEICNNANWYSACLNAREWVIDYLKSNGLRVAFGYSKNPQSVSRMDLKPREVLIVRHFDLTGKICPQKFVEDTEAWRKFVDGIATGAQS
jgi:N-acetylmuramoyl-L-alanine amidase CwlA